MSKAFRVRSGRLRVVSLASEPKSSADQVLENLLDGQRFLSKTRRKTYRCRLGTSGSRGSLMRDLPGDRERVTRVSRTKLDVRTTGTPGGAGVAVPIGVRPKCSNKAESRHDVSITNASDQRAIISCRRTTHVCAAIWRTA